MAEMHPIPTGRRARSPRPGPLEQELRRRVEGDVLFDAASRALYATDASNYRHVPTGVVRPRSVPDAVAALEVCREHGAAVTSRGGGTSLAGQTCNEAVILDFSRHVNRVLSIDPERRLARVEPGVVLDSLREQAERYHLTFGPDPSTHNRCTLGGMIGNNSCGVHSVYSGRTADNVHALEVVTGDGVRMRVGATSDEALEAAIARGGREGEIYAGLARLRDRYGALVRERYPKIPRRVSGYNLDELLPERGFHVARLLVGTEGTCVTIVEAEVRLVESPPKRALAVLGFHDVVEAARRVPEVLESKPLGLEGIDHLLVQLMRQKSLHTSDLDYLPEGGGFLIVEFGGESADEAVGKARRLADRMLRGAAISARVFDDPAVQKHLWEVRESGLGATAFVPGKPDGWPGWEDSAVAPERVGDYLHELCKLFSRYGYEPSVYGHFGQGCVHCRIQFDLYTAEGVAKYRAFVDEAADLVVSFGGSLSGEHGDGQSRAELLPRMFGPELVEAFGEMKRLFDPEGRMNPGKVVNPRPITADLRLGPGYRPLPVVTNMALRSDHGDLARAAERCVGVGLCRAEKGRVMCPSYRATGDEMHSTRGRAHLLFEAMRGDVLKGGAKEPAVREALDLCLACKGCKSDCPVNVDMASYKAEFYSHYYRRRLRPRAAYSMGLIYWWARLASRAPRLANFLTHAPGFAHIAKVLAGVDPRREMPLFAPETFRAWEARQPRQPGRDGRRVVLWPDTFNDHFRPESARSAYRVLRSLGYEVVLPSRKLCCGRPLYDWGMLDLARRQLRQVVATLREEIRAGTPVVGLEPSCISVFKDELTEMLPRDEDARRLRQQSMMLSQLIEGDLDHAALVGLGRRAVFQGHCHQHALIGFDADLAVMRAIGLEVERPEPGCCGMAGAFGFEQGHYEVSMKIGEHGLFQALRAADDEAMLIATGFSCREQMEQASGRHVRHLAEVVEMALAAEAVGVAEVAPTSALEPIVHTLPAGA